MIRTSHRAALDRSGHSFRRHVIALAVVACPLVAASAEAGTTKTLIGPILSDPASWSPTGVPTIADDVLIAPGYPTGALALNINSSAVATTLTFNSLNVTNQSALTLYNFTAANTNTATLILGGSGSSSNLVALSTSDLLYVATGSDFAISSGSQFGAIAVSVAQAGNFNIAGRAFIGGPLSIASGATLTNNVTGSLEFGGSVTSSGAFVKTGNGTLNLTGTNSSTFTGQITINAGTLNYNSAATSFQVDATITLGGGTLQYSNAASAGTIQTGNGRAPISLTTGTTSTLSVVSTASTGSTERTFNTFAASTGEDISGSGNLVIGGSTASGLSGVSFNKAHSYNGTTSVGLGQALQLTAVGSAANSALTLSGGSLFLATGRTATSTFTGITFGTGASAVRSVTGVTAATLVSAGTVATTSSLGTLTRTAAGATVDFLLPTTGSLTTTTGNAVGGNILGGYATQNFGASFAAVSSGVLAAYSGASTNYATTGDFDVAAGGTFTSAGVNSIRFTTGNTAVLNGAFVVNSGGILVTPTAGSTASTITGGTSLTSGNGTDLIVHQYNAAAPLAIASSIANNGATPIALTKAGSGTVILRGSNSYTGVTYVNGGTLQIGAGTTIGNLGSGNVVNNGIVSFSRSDDVSQADFGVISGTGSLVQTGAGTLFLTRSNTFTGGVTIKSGVVQINSSGFNLGGTGATTTIDGGNLRIGYANGVTSRPISFASTGAIDTNGFDFELTGDVTGIGSFTKTGAGTLTASTSTATYSVSGGFAVLGGAVNTSLVGLLGGTSTTSPSTVAPAFYTFSGGGRLNYGGSTDRAFNANRGVTIGTGGGTINLNGSANLTFNGVLAGAGRLTVTDTSTTEKNTVTFSADPSTGFTGGLTISNGATVATPFIGNIGFPTSVTADALRLNNGTFSYTAVNATSSDSTNRGVTLDTAGGTMSTGPTATLVISAPITGQGKLTKTGTSAGTSGGTLRLTAVAGSDYQGGTDINAGYVRANNTTGSATGTGEVNINNGGTLGGTGSVSGLVHVNTGGTITAGATTVANGNLKTTGGQEWKAGGTFFSKFVNTATTTSGFDTLTMSTLDLLSLSGVNKFNITLARVSGGTYTLAADGVYVLANVTGTVSLPSGFALPAAGENTDLSSLFVLSTTGVGVADSSAYAVTLFGSTDVGGGYNIQIQAAPEPTTAALVGLGASSLLGRRRRKAGGRSVLGLLCGKR